MSQDSDDNDGSSSLAYDNSHRAFLQAFLARSTLTYPTAKPILASIQSAHLNREVLPEDITEADFTSYINAINAAISPFDYEIRNTLPQTTHKPGEAAPPQRTRLYALVNTTSDGITQLATTHSAAEIAYVKRVLDGMFDTHNTRLREVMAVTSMQALQLARAPQQTNGGAPGLSENQAASAQGITKSEAEKVLKSMVDEGWFQKHRDYYLLSTRGLMELRGWLLDTYNEPEEEEYDLDEEGVQRSRTEKIKLCHGCRDIVTVGQRCKNLDCKIRFHDACTQTLARDAPRCPGCGAEWTGKEFVGLRAAR